MPAILPTTTTTTTMHPSEAASPTSVRLAGEDSRCSRSQAHAATASASPPPPIAQAAASRVHAGLSLSFDDLRVDAAPIRSVRTQLQWAAGQLRSCGRAPVRAARPTPLLHGVSGFIPANRLTGVMGGSGQGARRKQTPTEGSTTATRATADDCANLAPPSTSAGKTTLLNLLGCRLPGCGAAHSTDSESAAPASSDCGLSSPSAYRVSGAIRCNGLRVSAKFFSRVCAYVPQQSILLSSLTPRESILFASRLRLPSDTSAEAHERNTDRVLTSLSLHSCAHTRVGDELTGRGLSGGQQRRTNVGVELVTRPALICLDEPTTGLDNETSLHILETLRALTRPAEQNKKENDNDAEQPGGAQLERDEPSRGVTVVLSIHQPSAEMFALLDHLVLLAQGRVVYCGPAAAALGFFARLGHPCPPLENPPEYYLDVCAQGPEVVNRLEAAHRAYFEKHYRRLHDGDVACEEKQASMQRKLRALVCEPDESARDSTPEPAASASLHNRKFSPAVLQQSASPGSPLFEPAASAPFSRNIAPHSEAGVEEARMLVKPKHAQHDHLQPPQPQRTLRRFPAASPAAMDRINEESHDAEKGEDGEPEHAASIQLLSSRPESFRARVHHAATQLRYLTLRAHLNASRLPLLKGAQILQTVVLGLLIGLAFLNLGSDQLAVQNRLGCVYFIVLCVLFANTLTVVLNFAPERAVFLREQANNMYPVWSYFIARTSIDIVPTALCSFGMALICFWMIDSSASASAFGRFLLLIVLLAYAGQGIGLVVACGFTSRIMALIATPLAIAPFILFTPYAVNVERIPPYMRIVQVGSPFWWGFTGLMLSMFSGVRFHCSPDQTIPVPLSDGSYYLMCVYQSGADVLARFNIATTSEDTGASEFWTCCAVLALLCVVYRMMALMMLYKLSWNVKDATK